jgi:hypothetical protein
MKGMAWMKCASAATTGHSSGTEIKTKYSKYLIDSFCIKDRVNLEYSTTPGKLMWSMRGETLEN